MILVGVVLGLLGGGGAILTVPILVYLFHVPPVLATTYSLFVVGMSSLYGVWRYHRDRLVDYRVAFVFAIPSFLGTYLARRVLTPAMPEIVFHLGGRPFTKNDVIMMVFAIVMLSASRAMIRNNPAPEPNPEKGASQNLVLMILLGALVGFLAGFVGAGGGFLIVPALAIVAKIPMTRTVGTSLLIIAASSLVGFGGDFLAGVPLDWFFLACISILSSVGIFIGSYFSRFVRPVHLRKSFGWLVLVMGVFILFMQIKRV